MQNIRHDYRIRGCLRVRVQGFSCSDTSSRRLRQHSAMTAFNATTRRADPDGKALPRLPVPDPQTKMSPFISEISSLNIGSGSSRRLLEPNAIGNWVSG